MRRSLEVFFPGSEGSRLVSKLHSLGTTPLAGALWSMEIKRLKFLVVFVVSCGFLVSPSSSRLWANDCQANLQILSRALDYAMGEKVVLVHGTSLLSLKEAMRTGHFRTGVKGTDETQDTADHLYFYPARDRHNWMVDSSEFVDMFDHDGIPDYGAVHAAGVYAEALAKTHEFLKRMGHQPDDHEAYVLARAYFEQPDIADRFRIDLMEKFGLSPERLREIEKELRPLRGIVLGFDAQVMSQFELLPGDGQERWDRGTMDVKIHVPNGLPLEFLRGASTQSKQEHEELMEVLLSGTP